MTKKQGKSKGINKPGKKPESQRGNNTTIRVGDISGGTGFAIGPDAQAMVTQTSKAEVDEIAHAFGVLQRRVEALPQGADKNIAKSAVEALEVEARKGEQAVESTVQKWMNFLAETAPDVWEVAVDTFVNPVKGIGTAFRKIADKAKAEREAKKAEAAKK